MRYARTLAVAGIATAALFAATGSASAAIVDVKTATGSCPSGYRELARAGNTVLCYDTNIPPVTPPSVQPTTSGSCPTGYTEYSLLGRYGVCVRF